MCYICKCFSWGLDIIQRILTFLLGCCIFCVICIGITVAVTAGIAYGYNFMLAEFLSLGRSDVSVYVRRGQFYDTPDLGGNSRRTGDSNDLFASNASDYQETNVQGDSKSLSEAWKNALGFRKYAQKLTQYSNPDGRRASMAEENDGSMMELSSPKTDEDFTVIHLTRVFSVTANPAMQTTIIPGRTAIIMRKYEPIVDEQISLQRKGLEREFYKESEHPKKEIKSKLKSKSEHKDITKTKPDIKINLHDLPKSKLIPELWSDTKTINSDYPAEEMDEDSVVYKPV